MAKMDLTGGKRNMKERTLGDGMDSFLLDMCNSFNPSILRSMKPVIPKTPIHKLTPKFVPKERKQPKLLLRKHKDPKFVPYEPYKAATLPIIPRKKMPKKDVLESKPSKNNVDIQNLVIQMSEIRQNELNTAKVTAVINDDIMIPLSQCEEQKAALETDIKNLKETNAHLENQLKFQAQVNSELKTLLVAAVGEDLESRVQHLTEDKLQLARALLKSANHLTSHQEQTEWLSGQCEVWRSKFLASSLMVEELARWKSALTTKVADLQDCVRCLLDDRNKVYEKSLATFYCLGDIQAHLNCPDVNSSLKSMNLIDVSNVNNQITSNVKAALNIQRENSQLRELTSALSKYTPAENGAMQLLRNPITLPSKPDAVCTALMGAAMSISGGQMYLQHPSLHATCCPHCMGEVQDI